MQQDRSFFDKLTTSTSARALIMGAALFGIAAGTLYTFNPHDVEYSKEETAHSVVYKRESHQTYRNTGVFTGTNVHATTKLTIPKDPSAGEAKIERSAEEVKTFMGIPYGRAEDGSAPYTLEVTPQTPSTAVINKAHLGNDSLDLMHPELANFASSRSIGEKFEALKHSENTVARAQDYVGHMQNSKFNVGPPADQKYNLNSAIGSLKYAQNAKNEMLKQNGSSETLRASFAAAFKEDAASYSKFIENAIKTDPTRSEVPYEYSSSPQQQSSISPIILNTAVDVFFGLAAFGTAAVAATAVSVTQKENEALKRKNTNTQKPKV